MYTMFNIRLTNLKKLLTITIAWFEGWHIWFGGLDKLLGFTNPLYSIYYDESPKEIKLLGIKYNYITLQACHRLVLAVNINNSDIMNIFSVAMYTRTSAMQCQH